MLTCYIVDDESHSIDLLSKYISRTPGIELLGSAKNPLDGLKAVKDARPDIIFLDIDMPVLSGLEFSRLIEDKSRIVFTTALPDHAIDAFTNNIADYLLKPITYERFLNCLNRFEQRSESKDNPVTKGDHFFIQCEIKSKVIRLNFSDILYIESLNNYVVIYHNKEKHISYITLKELQDYLPPRDFSRIHKSFIINVNKIKSIEGNRVYLTEKTSSIISIGSTFKEAFLNNINNKTIKRQL